MSERIYRVEVRTFPVDKDAAPHPKYGEEWEMTRRDDGNLARFTTEHEANAAMALLEAAQPHAKFRVRDAGFTRHGRRRI